MDSLSTDSLPCKNGHLLITPFTWLYLPNAPRYAAILTVCHDGFAAADLEFLDGSVLPAPRDLQTWRFGQQLAIQCSVPLMRMLLPRNWFDLNRPAESQGPWAGQVNDCVETQIEIALKSLREVHERSVLHLDLHGFSAERHGGFDLVVGTRFGATAPAQISDLLSELLSTRFMVRDASRRDDTLNDLTGGDCIRRLSRYPGVHSFQLEIADTLRLAKDNDKLEVLSLLLQVFLATPF